MAAVFIFIRCVYRVAELQAGFGGKIANNEPAFMVLEGPMIISATVLLTVWHPAVAFGEEWNNANWHLRERKEGAVNEEKEEKEASKEEV